MKVRALVILTFAVRATLALPGNDIPQAILDVVLGHHDSTPTYGEFDGERGRVIEFDPPSPTPLGKKLIPAPENPFRPPGHGDLRGPCPALNTLANHGYLPRNGSARVEEIHRAVMEGFNMGYDLAAFVVSFATLARGNAYIGKLSIGGVAPDIPPVPGKFDGNTAGGIAKHGRFEGDVSSTRQDFAVGDNVNFQFDLYDILLNYIGRHGDTSPPNKYNIVNAKVFQEFKFDRFLEDQKGNRKLEFHMGRVFTTFSEVGFILELFRDSGAPLKTEILGSFFRNQTFPEKWYRRSAPAELKDIAGVAGPIRCAYPICPGANDENGNYVADPEGSLCGDDAAFLCAAYKDLVENNIPRAYNDQTGLFRRNIDYLLDHIYKPFKDLANCPQAFPNGPSDSD